MEDALALLDNFQADLTLDVLILVLMEDALAPGLKTNCANISNSLNPCFNGRCTRTFSFSRPNYSKRRS